MTEQHITVILISFCVCPNIVVDGKDHNPNFTADAVQYKNAFFKELTRREKKKLLDTPEKRKEFMGSFDWYRMTAQDEDVWSVIIDHLKK